MVKDNARSINPIPTQVMADHPLKEGMYAEIVGKRTTVIPITT